VILVFDQRIDDGVERLLDDLLRLQLRHPDFFRNRFDDLFFGHVGLSSGLVASDPERRIAGQSTRTPQV